MSFITVTLAIMFILLVVVFFFSKRRKVKQAYVGTEPTSEVVPDTVNIERYVTLIMSDESSPLFISKSKLPPYGFDYDFDESEVAGQWKVTDIVDKYGDLGKDSTQARIRGRLEDYSKWVYNDLRKRSLEPMMFSWSDDESGWLWSNNVLSQECTFLMIRDVVAFDLISEVLGEPLLGDGGYGGGYTSETDGSGELYELYGFTW